MFGEDTPKRTLSTINLLNTYHQQHREGFLSDDEYIVLVNTITTKDAARIIDTARAIITLSE